MRQGKFISIDGINTQYFEALHVLEKAGHMGNIECGGEFNERVLGFHHEQAAA
jgi:hypothetical protein